MRIDELLKEETHASRDSLSLIEGELDGIQSERAALVAQRKERDAECSGYSEEANQLVAKIGALEDHIADLEQKIASLRKEKEELQDSKRKLSKNARDSESLRDSLQKGISSLSEKERKLNQDRHEQERRLSVACCAALGKHMSEVERALFSEASERSRWLTERRRFEEAVRTDSEAAALKQDYDKCVRLLAEPGSDGPLGAAIRDAQQKIYEEINRRFPGALEDASTDVMEDEVVRLPYWRQETTGECVLFMPVSKKVWDRVGRGELGDKDEHAARLLFDLGYYLRDSYEAPTFDTAERYVGLYLRTVPVDRPGHFIVIAGKDVEIGYARLPAEIEEALNERH